jgi:uncharacterized cupredoxin-like copper-binding protein
VLEVVVRHDLAARVQVLARTSPYDLRVISTSQRRRSWKMVAHPIAGLAASPAVPTGRNVRLGGYRKWTQTHSIGMTAWFVEGEDMKTGSSRSWLLPATLTLAVLVSCSGGEEGPGVELTEFSVSVDPGSADSGETTFSVENVGAVTHEFVVVKTDLDDADLPTAEDGSVDEEGEGIEPVDEIEDIQADSSAELTVDLDAGNYVLFCNVVDGDTVHYQKGMHTPFTVE